MKKAVNKNLRGFTLVELLIVVIILALLAAIVVPQFASSTDDAKVASLDTTLANTRSAIDLYFQQHGHYPGSATAVSTFACAGSVGTGDAGIGNEGLTMADQLYYYTASNGMACSTKDVNHKFGPYMKKRDLPTNPISNIATLVVVTVGDLNLAPPVNTIGGWRYDNQVGKFIADIRDPSLLDAAGNDYYTH